MINVKETTKLGSKIRPNNPRTPIKHSKNDSQTMQVSDNLIDISD